MLKKKKKDAQPRAIGTKPHRPAQLQNFLYREKKPNCPAM